MLNLEGVETLELQMRTMPEDSTNLEPICERFRGDHHIYNPHYAVINIELPDTAVVENAKEIHESLHEQGIFNRFVKNDSLVWSWARSIWAPIIDIRFDDE